LAAVIDRFNGETMSAKTIRTQAIWATCILSLTGVVRAGTLLPPTTVPAAAPLSTPTTRPAPKPLSDNVKNGLAYLAHMQMPSGSWAQGDESQAMGNGMDNIKASPNVADTCMAMLSLLRSGSTPKGGDYQNQIARAIDFICGQVEAADSTDLYVTTLRQTRTQLKLGAYIDTFMTAQALAEVKNQMPDAAGTRRVSDALAKVIKKIEMNQQQDGRWAGGGWAPVLAQGMATTALNTAAQNGAAVDEKNRAAAQQVAQADFSHMGATGFVGTAEDSISAPTASSKAVSATPGGGDAGVELYSRAAQVAAMQASANTNAGLRSLYERVANSSTTQPADQLAAKRALAQFDTNDKDLAKAQDAVLGRMQDKQFVAGFGSNGGEEFLSYLDLGQSLMLRNDDAWRAWDAAMTQNLNRIQNGDGSWSGGHCITGRTFCTAAALMVLMIDRTPTTQPNLGASVPRIGSLR
jgi:hypothetical protein